jgi:hypothetical protein
LAAGKPEAHRKGERIAMLKIVPASDLKRGKLTRPTGPHWQDLHPGQRVRMKPPCRRRGTVVSVAERGPDGMSELVRIRWDSEPHSTYLWPTDYLAVVDEPLPVARYSTKALIAFLLDGCDCPATPHLAQIREELRRREGVR